MNIVTYRPPRTGLQEPVTCSAQAATRPHASGYRWHLRFSWWWFEQKIFAKNFRANRRGLPASNAPFGYQEYRACHQPYRRYSTAVGPALMFVLIFIVVLRFLAESGLVLSVR